MFTGAVGHDVRSTDNVVEEDDDEFEANVLAKMEKLSGKVEYLVRYEIEDIVERAEKGGKHKRAQPKYDESTGEKKFSTKENLMFLEKVLQRLKKVHERDRAKTQILMVF